MLSPRTMNCDACQNKKATIYLTQLVEGKMQKVNLCKPCADEKGVTDPAGFELADLLKGAGVESISETAVEIEDEKCDFCGFTQSDFKKTGRFGCSQCYRVFRSGLDNLLQAMHRHCEHHGKVPLNIIETRSMRERLSEATTSIAELNAHLDVAISVEDYEEAAKLRDTIANLENISSEAEKGRSEDE